MRAVKQNDWSATDQCKDFWERALAAGMEAAETTIPRPIFVRSAEGETVEVVKEGTCGYCRVKMSTHHPFTRWLLRENFARRGKSGTCFASFFVGSQSVDRAEAYARTVTRILRRAGVPVDGIEVLID